MAYILHNRLGSGGFVVEAGLALARQPYQLIAIDSQPNTDLPDTFRTTNPWRQVPVLELPDGSIMTESAAILIYLAAAHPGDGVGPSPATSAHAAFLRWVVFQSVNIYEGTLRRIYPGRFTTDANAHRAIREASIARNHLAFEVIETELATRPFLAGENMSLADVYLAMLCAWHSNRDNLPRCTEITHHVAANEIVAPIWQRNFDHRMTQRWGR